MFRKVTVLLLVLTIFTQLVTANAIPASTIPSQAEVLSSDPSKAYTSEGSGVTLETFRQALHRRSSQHVFAQKPLEGSGAVADAFSCEKWAENVACAQFDVLIVGGGPSGLQTAMSLGRLGRSVMIVDSQKYRNDVTFEAHDVIVLDGMTPAHIRELARGNLESYPSIHYSVGSITSLKSVDNATYFEAKSSIGTFTSRKVVLAMGILETLPAIDGIKDIWGSGGFWCPWCDGWEHRGGSLAVLDLKFAGKALALRKLNPNVTIYTNGVAPDPSQVRSPAHVMELLAAASIPIETSVIQKVAMKDPTDRHSDVVITLRNQATDVSGFLFVPTRSLHSRDLIEGLSLDVANTPGGDVIHKIDYTGQTSAFGVWAVGDSTSRTKNLANAIFTGKSAAVQMVLRLVYEESYARAGLDWRY